MSFEKRKKYAIVGVGSRSGLYSNAILDIYKNKCELVALCDTNQGRMDSQNEYYCSKYDITPIPTYLAEDFDKMIQIHKPEVVIVTCVDRVHHKYICRAMELGCDVISEKPMTIDEERCQAISDTIKKTGKTLLLTFNYRYSPRNTKVKELIQNGEIGDVVSVHFEWMLNTIHGADYFRRWHRDKKNSGGLIVHKSTHHFDLVNWWLDDTPMEVFGMGRLAFYGLENAENRGVKKFYHRGVDNNVAKNDPYAIDLKTDKELERLYLQNEFFDGYIRDYSVFSQGISIEDTMSVIVRYRRKATLTYSLNAFCPNEGYIVSINGTKGRIEINVNEVPYVSGSVIDQNNPNFKLDQDEIAKYSSKITLQKLWEKPQEVTFEKAVGGHGGGDRKMLDDIFLGASSDPYHLVAGFQEGAKSILIGAAANKSFQTGTLVKIKGNCLVAPDYHLFTSCKSTYQLF